MRFFPPHWSYWRAQIALCPIPLAGLALGIASLGNALEGALPLRGYARLTLGTVALACLLILASSAVINPRRWHSVVAHPIAGGVVPTFCMAWMTVSRPLHEYAAGLGSTIWCMAVGLHLVLLIGFIRHRLRQPEWTHMAPSWFIPPVGIVVATLNCPAPSFLPLCQWLLGIGMVGLSLLLPMMLYRLIIHPTLEEAAKPTLAIIAAPVSLTLAGYLSLSSHPFDWLYQGLAAIALLMTLTMYLCLFHLLRLPFTPAQAAYTFPSVISTIALQKLLPLATAQHPDSWLTTALTGLMIIELMIACGVVSYVAIGFIRHAYDHFADKHAT